MKAALITVAYNSAEDLRKHWQGARDLDADWIVVDNASTDDSAAVAEELGARVIRLGQNIGFSGANNAGVAESDAECFIFVNPDVEVTQAGVTQLATTAVDRGALVAPQLLNTDGTPQENGRMAPFLYRKFLHFLGSAASKSDYEVVARADELLEVSWAIGAAIAVPAAIFREIGGWDDGYFIYYEDSDICLRARKLGYPTLLLGTVMWIHAWARATRKSFSWFSWRCEFSSAFRFYRTYPLLLLPPRLLPRRGSGYWRDPR